MSRTAAGVRHPAVSEHPDRSLEAGRGAIHSCACDNGRELEHGTDVVNLSAQAQDLAIDAMPSVRRLAPWDYEIHC